MSNEAVLDILLSVWMRWCARGQNLSLEQLCSGRSDLLPDLQRRVQALRQMEEAMSSKLPAGAPADPDATRCYPSPASPTSPAPARPSLSGYDIEGELGRGSMGVVYQALDLRLRRRVALKMVLAGAHAGEAELARFRTEAEAVARLQHPGIVQIHEVGVHDGLPYFSLEFCPGGSLDRRLGGTPLPPQEAAALVQKLAVAVQAAHDKGVIHRDLKPANVLLAEDGVPKITDFGLAKKLDHCGLTQTGTIMGTPSYMAPEQASGNKDIGPACDVYALGAILYECLTGRPPFLADTLWDTISRVISDDPEAPSRRNPAVPADLCAICCKCLEKPPQRRYPSAAALAEDLNRFLGGEPVLARPLGEEERLSRWASRLGLEVLEFLGAGGIGSVYKCRQASLDRVVALKTIPLPSEGTQRHPTSPAALHFETMQARVRLEAQVLARLHHPNIVQIYDYGLESGLSFLVTEYVEGGTLADQIAGHPQPPGEAAKIIKTMALALHHAHLLGVIHRNVKPMVILRTLMGDYKLTGFELVLRQGGQTAAQEEEGAVVGAPAYVAPEQVTGQSSVGLAADVYALGAVLYECLTGRPPFQRATARETLQQVIAEEPVPVSGLQPGVPRDLEAICLKCLRKDPGMRYESALALAEDLDRFLAFRPVKARKAGVLHRLALFFQRHP